MHSFLALVIFAVMILGAAFIVAVSWNADAGRAARCESDPERDTPAA